MSHQPEFRVRVFLSVDLAGSTAFKSAQADNSWIQTFRKFYSEFLQLYRSSYTFFCEKHPECQDFKEKLPNLWKTIGDEAIFVNRVESLFQLFAYVHSFDNALEQYKTTLKSSEKTTKLDVKGNGWVASFPFPNQTISRPKTESEVTDETLPDERDEKKADNTPSDYDFLGPGIDAGFRISGNSSPSFMTLSPVLASLLAQANNNHMYEQFKFDFDFKGMAPLKGVLDEADYPIVGIKTERDKERSEMALLSAQLTGSNEFDPKKLINFLETFVKHHDIDCPGFEKPENGYRFTPPSSYQVKFVPYWEDLKKSLETADQNRRISEGAERVSNTAHETQDIERLRKQLKELDEISRKAFKKK